MLPTTRRSRPISTATVIALAIAGSSVASAQTWNNWDGDISASWFHFFNWTQNVVPTPAHQVAINPHDAPGSTVIFIERALGTAHVKSMSVYDWNCLGGCDMLASLNGIPHNGALAVLDIDSSLRVTADHTDIFGSSETKLSLVTLDVLVSTIDIVEENDANASLSLTNVNMTIKHLLPDGIDVGAGTSLSLSNSVIRAAPNGTYEMIVHPGATLLTNNNSEIRDSSVVLFGSMFVNGFTVVDSIQSLGTLFLSHTLRIEGTDDSSILGNTVGGMWITHAGTGTLTLSGGQKLHTGGLYIRDGGTVEIATVDQLGLGELWFNDGTLVSWTLPLTIDAHPITINEGGAHFDVPTSGYILNTSVTGSGGITKSGNGFLKLNGPLTFAGDIQLNGGHLEINSPAPSAGDVDVSEFTTLAGTGSVGGHITVAADGRMTPGTVAPFAVSTFEAGGVTFESGSELVVRISGTGPSSYDRISVAGPSTVNGGASLTIEPNGYTPVPGDEFLIIEGTSVTGTFNVINASGEGCWSNDVTSEGLVVRYEDCQPGCPADLDDDGQVALLDLLAVLADWGSCVGCPTDLDGDDDVDVNDLIVLLGAWGPCE